MSDGRKKYDYQLHSPGIDHGYIVFDAIHALG